jgi:hypothetical protein
MVLYWMVFYICTLKKTSAILLLSIYLFSTTEIHQLLKVPVVFQHYREHQAEDNDISVLRFLSIHYLHGSPRDKDYERDMELPFKSSGDCTASISIAFVSLEAPFSITKPIEIPEKKVFFVPDQFIPTTYLASIWQPPRFC